MPAIGAVLTPTAASSETGFHPQAKKVSSRAMGSNRRRILSVSPVPEDHLTLHRILAEMHWELAAADTFQEAVMHVSLNDTAIILCERDLPDGTWQDMLSHLAGRAEGSLLIVTSGLADEHLWAEVLNLGGYDVLAKPFCDREVQHVLTCAFARKDTPVRTARAAGASSG